MAAAALVAAAAAQGESRVVFGSFENAWYAERQAVAVGEALGIATEVIGFDAGGFRGHRVVSSAVPGEEARILRDVAVRRGWEGAWLLRGFAAPARTVAEPRDEPPPVAATQRVPAPAEPVDPVREVPPVGPRVEVASESPRTAAGEPAPVTVDLGERPLTLRATGDPAEAIVVPRYADRDLDIVLDGVLDEAVWAATPGYDDMRVIQPDTLVEPRYRTVVKYLYTERGLYVGAWMEQPPETLLARLSSRDEYINRDSFGITLDTSGEGLYGYWFSINLGGTVMDGKVEPEREFTAEWDGPWESATAAVADGWSAEAFLPWSMMSMPGGADDREMGIWANRQVAYIDERWSWPPLPFTGARFMSALGKLKVPGVAPRQELSLFPYASTTFDQAREDQDAQLGLDVFWRPSVGFQVTAAVNPDFGAVESDDVVINLTARETFFPEKRLFFLEGSEIFTTTARGQITSLTTNQRNAQSAGARRTAEAFIRPPTMVLNSRRIGGKGLVDIPDDVDVPGYEQSKPTDLLGAVKVTGQTGPVRYGALTAIEDDPELRGEKDGRDFVIEGDGRNFGVLRGLLESTDNGRRAVGYMGTVLDHPLRQAVVHGLDGHFLSSGGKLKIDAQLLNSDIDDAVDGEEQGYAAFGDILYVPRRGIQHQFGFDYFDDTIDINDMGFRGRNDIRGARYAGTLSRPGTGWFRMWRGSFSTGYWTNREGQVIRHGYFLRNSLMFRNRSEIRAGLNYFPARWDDIESRGNGSYRMHGRRQASLAYGTDTSKVLSWSVQGAAFEEELGGWEYRSGFGLTFKPTDRFSFDFDLLHSGRENWLIHQRGREFATFRADDWQPRIAMDLFFSARQQLRLTMQWAGIRGGERESYRVPLGDGDLVRYDKEPGAPSDDFTISRLTAQLRYRWQIAPLSDLFVVYTRGSNLPDRGYDTFGDLFEDALTQPVIDVLVIKLRYRFGG